MYETGEFPLDFQRNVVTPIPKTAGAKKELRRTSCNNPKTHSSKLLTGIIKRKIEQKVYYCLAEDQFRFRKGKGTREAILTLRVILAKRIDRNKKTYIHTRHLWTWRKHLIIWNGTECLKY
jgi:hypothetical protein